MATAQQPQTEFVRAISRLDATALVVGSMIGSGIFIVSAEILREVHAPGLLLVVWAVSGIVTLMGALTYGELAAMFPHAGGQYVYLREGISPLFGYLYGWTLFVVIQTGTIAAVAVAFARFTAVFWPGLTPDVFLGSTLHFPKPIGDIAVGLSPQRVLAVVSVAILTWINLRGVRTAAIIQTTLTAVKTGALALLILLGLTIGRHPEALSANFGSNFWATGGVAVGLGAVGAAMVGSLFSMDAWNNVGFAGSELKHPERDLPIAMGAGVLIVTVLYLLANVAYLSVLPAPAIATAPQDRVATAALEAILGAPGLKLMAAAIMISTFGEPALPLGHLHATPQLRDLRGARVLRSDRSRLVHAARETADGGAARARTRISLVAGRLRARDRRHRRRPPDPGRHTDVQRVRPGPGRDRRAGVLRVASDGKAAELERPDRSRNSQPHN